MRKVTGWLAAWFLFWVGHVVSRLLFWDALAWLYPAYNWLMHRSMVVQDWADVRGPWLTRQD